MNDLKEQVIKFSKNLNLSQLNITKTG